MKKNGKSRVPKLGFRRGRILVVEKKCGLGNVFSHTEMRPLLFCVSDTPKTALIYLKNGPNCCVRFYFGGRFKRALKFLKHHYSVTSTHIFEFQTSQPMGIAIYRLCA